MTVLNKREEKIRKKYKWHSHGDIGEPCKCDGCFLVKEIDNLRKQITDKDRQIRELEGKVKDKDKTIESVKNAYSDLRRDAFYD